ncbi:MAG: hypothetical protein AAGB32_04720, partial [Pseudomonadota bacterium]
AIIEANSVVIAREWKVEPSKVISIVETLSILETLSIEVIEILSTAGIDIHMSLEAIKADPLNADLKFLQDILSMEDLPAETKKTFRQARYTMLRMRGSAPIERQDFGCRACKGQAIPCCCHSMNVASAGGSVDGGTARCHVSRCAKCGCCCL